ncbi:MAG: hypothetical protein KJO35_02020, partial [Gammaproteobacteria bacterium]|nr:hypothetical protein [Gammaproteobacteria bacterium]
FVTLDGERYYAIRNVDKMAPFFVSLVSDDDHWMFIASNGGLTAGRVSPDTALFPYVTVDKIYDSTPHTGCRTLLRAERDGNLHEWEPFNRAHDDRYATTRNLYKNSLGNKILFEEINHDLQLAFRYQWQSSDAYGFVRHSELENLGSDGCRIDVVDGLQNLLPAGTPRFAQTNTSYLVDAYKWSELDEQSGLALITLFSGISDRAEPCESLRATTVFCLGLDRFQVLLCDHQLDHFRRGESLTQETQQRGVRGAYLVNTTLELAGQSSQQWQIVADLEQSQADAGQLIRDLDNPAGVAAKIGQSVARGSDALARIMASGDAFQATAEENVSEHHYANVLYNILRGGNPDDQYQVSSAYFENHVKFFNRDVYTRHRNFLQSLPAQLQYDDLLLKIAEQQDPQLHRLGYEYLPLTFGRRHGDPSRPWNQFAINLYDEHGNSLLSYQGNWRDIFQNWEAMLLGYPEFIESIIAKFVNASTVDGYNPYRITNEGIDWEIEDPEDPWSYIGYWGDHQIIYLQKLLELSQQYHPARLGELLQQPLFSYANVPYRIKPFDALLADAKSTVEYDEALEQTVEKRVSRFGADGKLLLDENDAVYQVSLLEKLLVTLLAKLGNLVVDGGIWLNTQRPEWNDANNALVGHGLSMVTLYYLRRYVSFLRQLLADQPDKVRLSGEVAQWLMETAAALSTVRPQLTNESLTPEQRYQALDRLGRAADHYRQHVYEQQSFSDTVSQDTKGILTLLDDALAVFDHSITLNRREDGLYHAYNLLHLKQKEVDVETLYPMLEGQVAALSSGALAPADAASILETLFTSSLYRPDQHSFMLYPDRELPTFLEKNRVPAAAAEAIPLIRLMLEKNDKRILERDSYGIYRFNADLQNANDLNDRLDELADSYDEQIQSSRRDLQELYEQVFKHRAFTGRSGGMFAFEGLGSIYWHMVSKLLLAAQENFFSARDQGADEAICHRLAELYYRVREGIGFNKTPDEYGAFPTDPYSHTPKHAGAQQPGMTGQVKEELLTRLAELGVRVSDGAVNFDTSLLRAREFIESPESFRYLDVDSQWQELAVPESGLAFTWCQVPFIYRLDDAADPGLTLHWQDGQQQQLSELFLPADLANEIFTRSGQIRQIDLSVSRAQLSGVK